MRAEVCRHVGRARALRFEAPACRDEKRVVADVTTVHDAQLPQVARLDDGAHVFDERVAAHVVGDGAHAVACLERLQHASRSPRRSSRAASRRRRARRARVPAASAPRGARWACRRARRPPRPRRAARRASRTRVTLPPISAASASAPEVVRLHTATTVPPRSRTAAACTRATNPEPTIAVRSSVTDLVALGH